MSKSKKNDRAVAGREPVTNWPWPVACVVLSAAFYVVGLDAAGTAYITAAVALLSRRG